MQMINEKRKYANHIPICARVILTNSTLWILCCLFNFGAKVILSLFKLACRFIAPIMIDLLIYNWQFTFILLVDFVEFNTNLEICLSSHLISVLGRLLLPFVSYDHYFVTKSWIHSLDRCRWFAIKV